MANKSDKIIRDGIRSLTSNPIDRGALPKIGERGAMPLVRGLGNYEERPMGDGGSGISGPLIEVEGTREYHDESVVMPSDGYFVYSVKAAKKLTFVDTDNNQVEVYLAEPTYD